MFQIQHRWKPAIQSVITDSAPYAVRGDRFLVLENEPDARDGTINLLLNWTAPRAR